ncbi:MAG: DUF4367 domain-containing protein [Clostridia bacterium]|nr:DUF4367 domain-containing protein [Clostridia bacterium]
MAQNDKERLKQALIDALLLDADELIESHTAPAPPADTPPPWLDRLLRNGIPRRRKMNRRVVIALICALVTLLLTGCALWYRQFVDFVVTVFEQYTKVEQQIDEEEFPTEIEEVLIPHTLPEGYELTQEQVGRYSVKMYWTNSNGSSIMFSQKTISTLEHYIDNERGDYSPITIGNYEVLYHCSEGIHSYIWQNNYAFGITSSEKLSEEQIALFIDSIQ